jgi:arylsulfatase A-like enzyme
MTNRATPGWYPIAARAVFGIFALLTSIYCLLAYIPDMYFAFIQAPFQPWLVMFIAWHPYTYCVTLGALGVALLRTYSGVTRRIAIELLGAHAILGIYFLIYRPFSHVRSDSLSFLWSLAWLFPLLWIGTLDYCELSEREDGLSAKLIQIPISAAVVAGLAVALLDPASAWLRSETLGRAFRLQAIDFAAWGWALLVHVLFALFTVCAFNAVGRLAEKLPARFGLRLAYSLLAIVGLELWFQRVLLASIPFTGVEAAIYSGAIAISLVAFMGGLLTGINPERGKETSQPRTSREAPATKNTALALVLVAAIYVVPALIGVMDWNSVLAKLWASALWILILALSLRVWARRVQRRYPVWLLLAVSAGGFFTYQFSQRNDWWQKRLGKTEFTAAAARHASMDASYAAIGDLWTIAAEKPCDALCVFLKEQTGIPSVVQPVDVKVVADLQPAAGPKPNIFIIVVDSLRQDYVSPYNPAVTFTPNIAQFASESTVMRNSFTRYAGTTLSEPAIWAGTMMLHKHYVQPFSPMNNLEKLVEADGYDQFVTVDTVLRLLLKTPPQLHRLDASMSNWSDQDLCKTAPEAQDMIDHRTDKNRPIFLYTQPQNIHVVSLERARALRPPRSELYTGFYAPAASEINRLDGCFGKFIRYLKTRGLYDNSIVVLTADHGESYGEFGHTNHAFGLHPEVLKVPLIFHLPTALRKSLYYDPEAIAFNIDVTPTLYYLLGHRPIADDSRFGRPLFTLTREEHDRFQRDSYLVAVCYGPIYGLLGRRGQDLFVANEMEGTYEYYDLAHDPFGTKNLVNSQVQIEGQRQLRRYVQEVADLYHYRPQRFSLVSWMIR